MYLPIVQRRWRSHVAVLPGAVSLVAALSGAVSPEPASAASTAAVQAGAPGVTWGAVKEVAGALNTGGGAQVQSVSCASPGNCSGGGYYYARPSQPYQYAFTISEVNGVWGTAQRMRGLPGSIAPQITTVSCGSAGNCSAGGFYFTETKSAAANHGFVVNEVNGDWTLHPI